MSRFRLGAVVVALAALTLWGPAVAFAATGCQMGKFDEIPVHFVRNQPLIHVSINGQPAEFLIDTGAVSSLIDYDAALKLGLQPIQDGNVRFYGVGGGQDAFFVNIAKFGLSTATAPNVHLFVIKGGRLSHGKVIGILGRDFLGVVDVEFNLSASVIRLFKPQNCRNTNLAYWSESPGIADLRHDEAQSEFQIEVTLNGKKVHAILDSGAFTTVITPEAARLAGISPADFKPVGSTSGIGNKKVDSFMTTVDKVTVGDETINHAKIRVADLFGENAEDGFGTRMRGHVEGQPEMLLGADFVRSHRILIANSQSRLYFTYTGGQVFELVAPAAKVTVEDPASVQKQNEQAKDDPAPVKP